MNSGTATELLLLAKDGGFLDEEPPSDPEEAIKLGQWWYEQAIKARDGGMQDNETVTGIIALAEAESGSTEELPDDQAAAAAEEEPEPVGSPPQEDTPAPPADDPDENHGPGIALPELKHERTREGLPVPPEVEGEVTPMPRDLGTLGDRELRKLTGEYNALFARATWLAAIEGSDLSNAEHMAEHSLRVARRRVPRVAVDGRKLNAEDVNDEARMDVEFMEWETRRMEHDRLFREYRALKEIYSGHLDRLSREATIRDQEYQRSGT